MSKTNMLELGTICARFSGSGLPAGVQSRAMHTAFVSPLRVSPRIASPLAVDSPLSVDFSNLFTAAHLIRRPGRAWPDAAKAAAFT